MTSDSQIANPHDYQSVAGDLILSVSEAKQYAEFDHTNDDDNIFAEMLRSIQSQLENRTNRAFTSQTRIHMDDEFPTDCRLQLKFGPLVSVTSVESHDGTSFNTYSSSNYRVDTAREPGLIVLEDTASWPTVGRNTDGVKITYVAGMTSSHPLWMVARHAVRLAVKMATECRTDYEVRPDGALESLIRRLSLRGWPGAPA